MILYAINCKSPGTNYEWEVVTIHKTLEGAIEYKEKYEHNCKVSRAYGYEYLISKIDTDIDSDIVYDCYNIDIDNDSTVLYD